MFDSLLERGGLSLDRLRNFLLIADAGSISKAAGANPNRQSLMSRQIRELEEFFGTDLTRRRGKGIAITPAGRRLAALVRTNLQGLEDFLADIGGEDKTFGIGAGASVIEWLVCPAAGACREALGNASVRLEPHRTADLVERVRDGRLDFAVVRADALPDKASSLPLTELKFVLCIPNKLGGKRLRLPRDLGGLPLALPSGGGSFHRVLTAYFESVEIPWQPAIESTSFLQALALVASEEFAAILPSIGAKRLPENKFTLKPIADLKSATRKLVLHWNQRQMQTRDVSGTSIRKLRDTIRDSG